MKTITEVERQSLANQYKILAKLYDDDSLLVYADILEYGYTGLYGEVLNTSEEVSFDICKESDEILTMYRRIENAKAKLKPEEKEELDLSRIDFNGFDANNDLHYGYMTFQVEKMNLWEEHKDNYLNSHDQTSILKYRRLLEYQKELLANKKYELDKNDLIHMIEIV